MRILHGLCLCKEAIFANVQNVLIFFVILGVI